MYDLEPDLCFGPWYSRAWAWGREAAIYVAFLVVFPVWVMMGGGPFERIEGLRPGKLDAKLPNITCAKCGGKAVDFVLSHEDSRTCQLVHLIGCHGETEKIEIPDEQIEAAEAIQVIDYVAFKPKPLELPSYEQA